MFSPLHALRSALAAVLLLIPAAHAQEMLRLAPEGLSEGAMFGYSLSAGDFGFVFPFILAHEAVVVGAPHGELGDSSGIGAAYLYHNETNADFTEPVTLPNPAPEAGDLFGFATKLRSGGLIIVGAPGAGRAYTFGAWERVDGAWAPQAVSTFEGAAGGDFGAAVGLGFGTALVGAPAEEEAGAVYVYKTCGGSGLLQTLYPSVATDRAFGRSLDVDNSTLAIGAVAEDGSGVVYLYRQADGHCAVSPPPFAEETRLAGGSGFGDTVRPYTAGQNVYITEPGTGSVYRYDRSLSSGWGLGEEIPPPPNAPAPFGSALSDGTCPCLVGAPSAQGDSGVLYVYNRQDADLPPAIYSPPEPSPSFGYDVSLVDVAFVGAPLDRGTGALYMTPVSVPVSAEPSPPVPSLVWDLYPNPFRSHATLSYTLPEAGPVRVTVYDVLGREVAVLHDGATPAGEAEVTLAAAELPAGVYLVRFEAGRRVETQRVTVVR